MKSNLGFFLERVAMESDEVEDSNTLNPAAVAQKHRKA
jgi:hypothetical protein